MHRSDRSIRFFPLAILVIAAGCGGGPPTPPDPVVAQIGFDTVHRSDLERVLLARYLGPRALRGYVTERLFEREAEQRDIVLDRELLRSELLRRLDPLGIEISPDRIDGDALSEGGDPVLDPGVSLEDRELVTRLALEVRKEALIEAVVRSRRSIGEYEIQSRYQRLYQDSNRSVRGIAFARSEIESARSLADECARRLRAGETFEKVASDAAALGARVRSGELFRRSIAAEELGDALFSLPEGATSEVLTEADFGYHLFVVDRVREPGPLADRRERIRSELESAPVTIEEIDRVGRELREAVGVTEFPEALWKEHRP